MPFIQLCIVNLVNKISGEPLRILNYPDPEWFSRYFVDKVYNAKLNKGHHSAKTSPIEKKKNTGPLFSYADSTY